MSDTIVRRRLFAPGERILVAVSGGLDSMVMLHLMLDLAGQNGWQLTVAHLNHQLRGRSSNADERLVRRTAEALSVPIVVERADVRKLARSRKLSLEMAARKARHEFLARTGTRLGLSTIALGHHADDQLELFFLRLLRGSGSQGLVGMKWKSPSPVAQSLRLVRPLLDLPKAALHEYAIRHKIAFREDASNACQDFLRNRVRHQLLPLLKKKYQPALDSVVSRTAEILAGESEFAELSARNWLSRLEEQRAQMKRKPKTRVAHKRRGCRFEDLHVAIQRRVIQMQLPRLGIVSDYELVEKLRSKPEKRISITRMDREPVSASQTPLQTLRKVEGSIFCDADGILHLVDKPVALASFASESLTCDLSESSGSAEFGGLRLRWKFSNGTFGPKPLPGRELFDADKVGEKVVLRHWRPGDRFQPIGMTAAVKLQDLFTNLKISADNRRGLVLAATSEGEVFWAEGLRISERFKLTSQTIRRLHWSWERL